MPWVKRTLRGNDVYVRSDDAGNPTAGRDGRIDVVYKLTAGAKVYRANLKNLESYRGPGAGDVLADPPEAGAQATAGAPGSRASAQIPGDAIIIYTDGACTGNPGPMGLGAVITDGDERIELSEYLGEGTNNIAELTAILRALQAIPAASRQRTIVIHSDSTYSIGLLSKGWKAKANQALVAELRALLGKFGDVRFVKVKGHAGIPENERCDELATGAIANR